MPEIRRHDADNGVAIFVQPNPAAYDIAIATELALPESIADHCGFAETGDRILGSVHSPQGRIDAKDLEVIEAGAEHLDAVRMIAPAQGVADRPDGADALESAGAIAQILQFRHRHADVLGAGAAQVVKDAYQLLRMLKRKRPQEHGVHHGEDCDVRPDAERQGEYRDGCESGSL